MKGITEAGGRKIGEGGEEDVGDKKGREEVAGVGEVIERVRRDPGLDELKQRLLRCVVDPRKSNPLSVHYRPVELSRRNVKQPPPRQVYLPPHDGLSDRSFPCRSFTRKHYSILTIDGITGYLLFGPGGNTGHEVVE